MNEDPWNLVAATQLLRTQRAPPSEGGIFIFEGEAQISLHTYPLHLSTQPPSKVCAPVGCWLCPALDLPVSHPLVSAFPSPLEGM